MEPEDSWPWKSERVIFWDITLCNMVHRYQCYEGIRYLHFQGIRIFRAWEKEYGYWEREREDLRPERMFYSNLHSQTMPLFEWENKETELGINVNVLWRCQEWVWNSICCNVIKVYLECLKSLGFSVKPALDVGISATRVNTRACHFRLRSSAALGKLSDKWTDVKLSLCNYSNFSFYPLSYVQIYSEICSQPPLSLAHFPYLGENKIKGGLWDRSDRVTVLARITSCLPDWPCCLYVRAYFSPPLTLLGIEYIRNNRKNCWAHCFICDPCSIRGK
jgi:hypothetical protein